MSTIVQIQIITYNNILMLIFFFWFFFCLGCDCPRTSCSNKKCVCFNPTDGTAPRACSALCSCYGKFDRYGKIICQNPFTRADIGPVQISAIVDDREKAIQAVFHPTSTNNQ